MPCLALSQWKWMVFFVEQKYNAWLLYVQRVYRLKKICFNCTLFARVQIPIYTLIMSHLYPVQRVTLELLYTICNIYLDSIPIITLFYCNHLSHWYFILCVIRHMCVYFQWTTSNCGVSRRFQGRVPVTKPHTYDPEASWLWRPYSIHACCLPDLDISQPLYDCYGNKLIYFWVGRPRISEFLNPWQFLLG